MSEKLIPCPICGSENTVRLPYNDRADIERCKNCNLTIIVPFGYTMWNTRPIEDELRKRIAELGLELGRKSVELGELVGRNIIWEVINDELKSRRENLERENDRLQEKVSDLLKRIAELEAENDQLTAHDATERQDDKCSKPEPNVCEACGGDGTVLLTDGYKGQVIATAKCIYCNGTGRVNKERER